MIDHEEPTEIVGRLSVVDACAVAKNVAMNGRMFVACLFVANLTAFHGGYGKSHWVLAIVAAAVYGIAYLSETSADENVRRALGTAASVVGALVLIFSLLTI